MMKKLIVPATVGLAVAVGGVGLSAASAEPAGSCGPAHRYIDAQVATFGPGNVVIVDGRTATLKCGGEDDSSYVSGKKLSLTMAKSATVTVWKVPENPDGGTRTVPATSLPKWLKKNYSEPVYKITGPNNAATKLVEEWHP
jgi:hypothetical protein